MLGFSRFLFSLFINEFLERFEVSLTFVVFSFLVSFWIPFQGWVTSDFNSVGLVGSGIKFGDDNVAVVLVMLTKLIPNWSELFAVSAPWGIVFDEDIFGWV